MFHTEKPLLVLSQLKLQNIEEPNHINHSLKGKLKSEEDIKDLWLVQLLVHLSLMIKLTIKLPKKI